MTKTCSWALYPGPCERPHVRHRCGSMTRCFLDLTAFYNSYTDLASEEVGTTFLELNPAPIHLVLPIEGANLLHGESHGAEMSLNWKPANRWTLSPGYSYLQLHVYHDPTS